MLRFFFSCQVANAGVSRVSVYVDAFGSLPASFRLDAFSGSNIVGATQINARTDIGDIFRVIKRPNRFPED